MNIMAARIFLFIHLMTLFQGYALYGQGGCITAVGALYGTANGNERGKSLAPTLANDGFYAAGMKEDSVLLLKLNLEGIVEWSRTIDVLPGEEDHVSSLIADSDGMLAIAGMSGDMGAGGIVFAFRYNPASHQVLWTNFYSTAIAINYSFGLIQKGSGGNYLLSNNPLDVPNSNNDFELIEISKNTGAVLPVLSKHYHLGSSENMNDMVYHAGFLYGCGRYSDGPAPADMRHTLIKLNGANGTQAWSKMGHRPGNVNARLYGEDLIIEQNEIYSIYNGDPNGVSTTVTKLYVQKTDLDGNLLWLNQYELPANNDVGYEMIKSGNGIVILAGKKASPSEILMFKIDLAGAVLWAKSYQFSPLVNAANVDRGMSQLIEAGNMLVFTGIGTNVSGGTDMLIVRTDLNGEVDIPCVTSQTITIPVTAVSSPTFYTVNPNAFTVQRYR